jgi:hypothetical protein
MATSLEKLKEALSELDFGLPEETPGRSIDVEAYSIEEGLQKAAEVLSANISDLVYDIIEQGKRGIFKKKPYLLRVSVVRRGTYHEREAGTVAEKKEEEELLTGDRNGSFKVKITRIGVMLKVTPPRGSGSRVRVEDVLSALSSRGVTEFDKAKVTKIVREAKDEYIKIGEWIPDERNDAKVIIEVSGDEMKAFMTLIPPRPRGRVLDIDDVIEALHDTGVVYGIKKDVIEESLEEEVYNVPILAAEGLKPEPGRDAQIVYNFRTEKKLRLEEDEKGQVNFKDLDLVENVVAGQLLATKIQATEGKPGRTVTNKVLLPKPGNDVSFNLGKNTELSPDGMSVLATINGQVTLLNGKINVDPIYEVKGDVDIHTGNILFLGTVIVKGNVEDGFSIKAAGDIQIMGSVGKCLLDAEGDVHIKQGIMGKLGGEIRAGGSVWAKFLEQVNVTAGKSVFVQDGIMHCKVDATEKVVCFGKRATIVGGRIRAGEIVNTKTLGSVSFTETIVEVGVDPKSRQRLYDLEKEKLESESALEKLNANITTLQNQRKAGRSFTEEKEELLEKMMASSEELSVRLREINDEMNELKSYLKLLTTIGKVSVLKNVYPGVRIAIKDIYYDVTNEFKYVTFVLEGNRIRIKKYEHIEIEEIVGLRIR